MPAILYIETNFLLSFATGRDQATDALITNPVASTTLAIPDVCFMEAFSVLEGERRKNDEEIGAIESRIRATRRNVMSPEVVASLVGNLTFAASDIRILFQQFEVRLTEVTTYLSIHAELIDTSGDSIQSSLHKRLDRRPDRQPDPCLHHPSCQCVFDKFESIIDRESQAL